MLNWQSIDTVLLDMDGTLLDLHFDNYFWLKHLPSRYAAIHKLPEESVKDDILGRIQAAQGSLNWYCIDYWSEQLQLDIPALKREVAHLIQIRPYVIEFLQQIRESGRRLLLVTNAHRKSLDIKLERTDIGVYFDALVVSHDYRAAKEEPAFWHQLHINHPFERERTLLIDDNYSVLDAAKLYGIKHLLTLLQPDSQGIRREQTHYPGILHFDELLPLKTLLGND